MDEEEKKAIHSIKRKLECEQLRNNYKILVGLYKNDEIEILLNLIEKQQKELNQEKEKNKALEDKCKDLTWYFENQKNNFMPKSKIREKIEEYNKMINATYGDITHQGDIRRDNCIEIRNVLQELLEE